MARSVQPTRQQFTAYEEMYRHFNRTLFDGTLPPVILNFSRMARTLGFFAPSRWDNGTVNTHEISLNPSHLAKQGPRETASTLVHEMCHLWQEEFGTPPRRGYHDREWAQKMQEVGLQPVDPKTGQDRMSAHSLTHRIVEGGPFDVAFAAMPAGCLLPWRCQESGGGGTSGGTSRNKTKYTCACGVSMWGRPGWGFTCHTCGKPFVDAQTTAAAA